MIPSVWKHSRLFVKWYSSTSHFHQKTEVQKYSELFRSEQKIEPVVPSLNHPGRKSIFLEQWPQMFCSSLHRHRHILKCFCSNQVTAFDLKVHRAWKTNCFLFSFFHSWKNKVLYSWNDAERLATYVWYDLVRIRVWWLAYTTCSLSSWPPLDPVLVTIKFGENGVL